MPGTLTVGTLGLQTDARYQDYIRLASWQPQGVFDRTDRSHLANLAPRSTFTVRNTVGVK